MKAVTSLPDLVA